MPKVRQHILDSLTKNRAPGSLLLLTNDVPLGRKLLDILNTPSAILEVPLNTPVKHLASLSVVRESTHIIELYQPDIANSIYLKELRQALFEQGKYVLALWNWDERYLDDQFWGNLDYGAISASVTTLAAQLSAVENIRITSDNGTDISFSVAGRPWISADGYCDLHKLAQLPDGELYTCPVEETFSGTIMVDGTVSRLWLPDKPLKLKFEAGTLVDGNPAFIDWLERYAGGIRTIGEFALGMNPNITSPYHNISTDEKEGGSVHFALGDSYNLGLTHSIYHVDFVVRKPTIYTDGRILHDYLPKSTDSTTANKQSIPTTKQSLHVNTH